MQGDSRVVHTKDDLPVDRQKGNDHPVLIQEDGHQALEQGDGQGVLLTQEDNGLQFPHEQGGDHIVLTEEDGHQVLVQENYLQVLTIIAPTPDQRVVIILVMKIGECLTRSNPERRSELRNQGNH